MKLWQKISLVCCAVLIVMISACGFLMILQSKTSILELTYKQAREKQNNLVSSFSEMVNYYSLDDDLPSATYSLVTYCFSRFADPLSVLQKGDETLYSEISIYPGDYLDIKGTIEQKQFTGIIDGKNILIIGSSVTVKKAEYMIFVVEDISPVYNNLYKMIGKFALISAASIVLGTVLIIILVRRAFYPLTAEILHIRGTPLVIECGIDSLEMDMDLMKSLVINLVDNASKASEPG